MKQYLCSIILGAAAVIVLWAGASIGDVPEYVENFATTQHKDTLNTSAWWDTASGELKLFPFVPTLAGSFDTPGYACGVAISGDYAYVADGGSGLQVIDISNPTVPTLAGSCDTPGLAWGVAISGDYAYVADYGSGLQVIDISDPTVPMLAGSCDTPGSAYGVVISGDYAYMADYGSGLQVIDISNPTVPTLAGSFDTPGSACGVAISGDYAYVADWGSGLQVIDISNPTAPTLAGSFDTPHAAGGVAISGDYAYVADGSSGLQVIDISNPTAPTLAGSFNTPGTAGGVAISGDYAYVADWISGLQVIDISDPTFPKLAGSCDTPGSARGVAISGDYAYVADYDYGSGLQVIDISNPTVPMLAGSCDTPGSACGVAISGDYGYVADWGSGLQVIDISNPTVPTLAGSCDTPGSAYGVAISGDYAYVADWGSGLQVIDISNPTVPTLVGSYDTPGYAYDVAISGDYAYVVDGSSGLQVIDISNPTVPTLAGSCNTPGTAGGVAISGDYAYVADYGSGLQVIDISDPTVPKLARSCDTPGTACGVAISGDYAYVADWGSGLQVIDISNPTAPMLAGSCDTPHEARGVAISGDYAYVADGGSGLQVIDISNPTVPTLAGSCDTPSYAYGVAISGDYAYVADYVSGLPVIQVFQSEFDTDNNEGRSLAVNASNDTIFVARLMTIQTNTVTWELSADGGGSWLEIAPNGSWDQLTVPGTDLVWRSTHALEEPGVNPTVTQLEINWLVAVACIDSIVDVPADQGGWVRVFFTRSGRDFSYQASLPIDEYGIWQRVDDLALIAVLKAVSTPEPEQRAAGDRPHLDGVPVITHQGRTYVQSRPGLAASSFPPGIWEWVATVPAIQQDEYIARVSTAADSSGMGTNYVVCVITAHTTTPSIWYVSEPDSGYSVDNIAPAPPLGLAVAYNTGSGNQLIWDPSPEPDFQYYRVYRGDNEDFIPAPGNLVHETATEAWTDPEYDGWDVHYKITALDYAGNESDAASPETVTSDDTPSVPTIFALYQNVPNPFNPTTTIRFDLPRVVHVKLSIYNVKGELVATIVDCPMTEGRKEALWAGTNESGSPVASGIYFYRLDAGDFMQTRKMVLLR